MSRNKTVRSGECILGGRWVRQCTQKHFELLGTKSLYNTSDINYVIQMVST